MRLGIVLVSVALLFPSGLARAQVSVPGAVAKPATLPAVASPSVIDLTLIDTRAAPVAEVLPAAPAAVCVPMAPCTPYVPRIWGSAEYLLWWTSAAPVPTPMVTAATNLVDITAGQLNSPNTAVLLGGQAYNMAARSGGRFTLGTWLGADALWGVEGTYLFLAPTTASRAVQSNGTVPIGLPFYDVLAATEGFAPLSIPGIRTGGAALALTNRLQSGEVNGLARLISTDWLSVAGLAGFRYLNFDENLNFGFAGRDSVAGLPAGHFAGFDRFNTNNNFFGGQLGLRGEVRMGDWFVNVTGKCAFGNVGQSASVSGAFAAFAPAVPVPPVSFAAPGGFYALPTNMGQHTHSAFAVVPEGTVNVGYNIGPRTRVFAGYSFLYISNVERPGTAVRHMINTSVSPGFAGPGSTLVGPAAPTYVFTHSDFWAQGLNFGVQVCY